MIGTFRDQIRTLRYTRNIPATWNLHTSRVNDAMIQLPGYRGPLHFRTGTSDAKFLRWLAWGEGFKEYRLPAGFTPRVIVDIGANIGAASLWWLEAFPDVRLFAFEPLPDNARLLKKNLAPYPNATVVPHGLGARSAERSFMIRAGGEHSGGGFAADIDPGAVDAPVLSVLAIEEALQQYQITSIDLLKIDAEQAEYEILPAIPTDLLQTIRIIVGEIHAPRTPSESPETLLALLEPYFDVRVETPGPLLHYFSAINRCM